MQYEVCKSFPLGGKQLHRGDPFDPNWVTGYKLVQMLNHRMTRPVQVEGEGMTPPQQPNLNSILRMARNSGM